MDAFFYSFNLWLSLLNRFMTKLLPRPFFTFGMILHIANESIEAEKGLHRGKRRQALCAHHVFQFVFFFVELCFQFDVVCCPTLRFNYFFFQALMSQWARPSANTLISCWHFYVHQPKDNKRS